MPAPIIAALPTAPQRTDASSVFSDRADAFVAALATFRTEINLFGDYLNDYTPEGGAADGDVTASGLTMSTARMLGRLSASTGAIEELTAAQVRGFALVEYYDANFTDDGEMIAYAHEAVTITQVATTGTGTATYEKSTAAAPNTFASATPPLAVESGAKWKVIASGVSGTFAAHLKRSA